MQGVRAGESEDFACAARSAGDGEAVRWIGPEREADRRTLAAWCSAVGPVEFIPEPARHQPAPAADSTLAVGTWNVHVGGGDLPGFLRAELGYECGVDGPTGFRAHFVLLVQEAYRASATVPVAPEGAIVSDRIASRPPDGPRRDIVQVAEECGLALFYAPSTRNGKEAGEAGREDRGSAILSTLLLSNPVAVELPLEAQRRVTVAADVHGPEKSRLRVASVHFDVASNVLRVLSTGGSMRVRQNDGQTEALDSLDPQGTLPIIVGGDLNTWSSRETVIQRMLVTYPESPDPGREKTRGNWPPDHLFFRAGTGPFDLVEGSYRVVVDDHGSDHRARLAEFVLR
jgi:endonuclease/exonuclease/phosphatase family metal-dependent hydrolase